MTKVFINCMPNNLADKRRATFKKLSYQPLPLKKRKWEAINENCPICLEQLGNEDTRLTCFGKSQCNHTFHRKCITQWLLTSRHCPLCNESGGVVGCVETKEMKPMCLHSTHTNETKDIPHMMIIDAFFNLANLKINSVTFMEQRKQSKRVPWKKYNLHIDVCNKQRCNSKHCKHMISSPTEFIEWYQGIPKNLRHPTMTLKRTVEHCLMPSLRLYAHHVHEHLYKVVQSDSNLRRYEYNVHKAKQS